MLPSKKDYFEEEGLDLTLVTGFGADKVMAAVLSGDAEIGFMGAEASVYAFSGGEQNDPVVNFASLLKEPGISLWQERKCWILSGRT